jgi:hypothetical protein
MESHDRGRDAERTTARPVRTAPRPAHEPSGDRTPTESGQAADAARTFNSTGAVSPVEALALQRTAGNQAMTHAVQRSSDGAAEANAHRVMAGPAPVVEYHHAEAGHGVQRYADDTVQRTPMDQNAITALLTKFQGRVRDPQLNALIGDILQMLPNVTLTINPENPTTFGKGLEPTKARKGWPGMTAAPAEGGGYAPDPTARNTYVGSMGLALPHRQDQVAVLIHELTHVLNWETIPGMPDSGYMPMAPASGQTPADLGQYVHERIAELIPLLNDSGLPEKWKVAAENKLRIHVGMNPQREYDSVLSHLLTWSEQYGDRTSAFHQRVSQLVAEARQWRRAGGAMVANAQPNPEAAQRAMVATPAHSPTTQGRNLLDQARYLRDALRRRIQR